MKIFKISLVTIMIILLNSISGFAESDVVDSSAYGFTVKNTVIISADSIQVYNHLVSDINKWWDSAHTFSGSSSNLYLTDTSNGCFCEKLKNGGSVRHLNVVFAEPGKILRLRGALGPLQAMAVTGSLTWKLNKKDNLTEVELTYSVGGYRPGGLQVLAPVVDKVLFSQLKRLKSFIETGNPEPNDELK